MALLSTKHETRRCKPDVGGLPNMVKHIVWFAIIIKERHPMIRQAQAARACTFLKKSGPMPTNAILRMTESGLMPTKIFLMLTASKFPQDSGRCKSRGKATLVQGAQSTLVGVGKSPLVRADRWVESNPWDQWMRARRPQHAGCIKFRWHCGSGG